MHDTGNPSQTLADIPPELTMTTNGTALPRFAGRLAAAGVRRVNVSLDTLDADRFTAITRGGDLSRVIAGIDAAQAAGPVSLYTSPSPRD